jgi:hypothetical protein
MAETAAAVDRGRRSGFLDDLGSGARLEAPGRDVGNIGGELPYAVGVMPGEIGLDSRRGDALGGGPGRPGRDKNPDGEGR